jgi:DNA topoisomerase-6 subunit B
MEKERSLSDFEEKKDNSIGTKKEQEKAVKTLSAEELSKRQREISIAEFFEKNRHLLGFDNNRKALLTAVKEAVDNSLDACEEARILPEIMVEITQMDDERFKVAIEDNGPGIVKSQIPKIFGKLLYGSKFHSMKQSRGQQGIGISAVALYSQLTTGRSIRIWSRTSPDSKPHYLEIHIDTTKNKPIISKNEIVEWDKERGTRIEFDLEGSYYRGAQSVDEYLKQTAIINPHATIIYSSPKAEQIIYARATEKLPEEPDEIKPHPYGIELGALIRMLRITKSRTIHSFLTSEFSRVSARVASEVLEKAGVNPTVKPKEISRRDAEQVFKALKKTKIMAPPMNCLSPIKPEELEKGIRKEVNAEYYDVVSRPASVYRGNPFVIEAGIAYGGTLKGDETVTVLRFANRVPLLYQAGACAFTKSIIATNWRNYGLAQPKGSLPIGPAVIVVHMASVWTPYTSEAKEAIASYEDIVKEIKLALQELGRNLKRYISKKKKIKAEVKKRSYITKFIPHIAFAISNILEEDNKEELEEKLKIVLEEKRGKVENVEFDEKANKDYDETFAVKAGGGIVEDYLKEEDEEKDKEEKKEGTAQK